MAPTTHPITRRPERQAVPAVVRRFASRSTLAHRLHLYMAEVVAAGQLGADAETEIGRSTGARV